MAIRVMKIMGEFPAAFSHFLRRGISLQQDSWSRLQSFTPADGDDFVRCAGSRSGLGGTRQDSTHESFKARLGTQRVKRRIDVEVREVNGVLVDGPLERGEGLRRLPQALVNEGDAKRRHVLSFAKRHEIGQDLLRLSGAASDRVGVPEV